MEEVTTWRENYHPISKMKKYLIQRGLWDEERDSNLAETADANIMVGVWHCCWEGVSTTTLPLPGGHAAS